MSSPPPLFGRGQLEPVGGRAARPPLPLPRAVGRPWARPPAPAAGGGTGNPGGAARSPVQRGWKAGSSPRLGQSAPPAGWGAVGLCDGRGRLMRAPEETWGLRGCRFAPWGGRYRGVGAWHLGRLRCGRLPVPGPEERWGGGTSPPPPPRAGGRNPAPPPSAPRSRPLPSPRPLMRSALRPRPLRKSLGFRGKGMVSPRPSCSRLIGRRRKAEPKPRGVTRRQGGGHVGSPPPPCPSPVRPGAAGTGWRPRRPLPSAASLR